jgi:hypothetical protein
MPDSYLSICAVFRDEGAYLREWVELHRLVGVDRFYLYDNRSADDSREVLEPYVDEGIAVVQDWPEWPAQIQAYDHCIKAHRDESRWIAFIDVDEFLFSPTGQRVSGLLAEFERFPGVGVNWAVFGSSGHRTKPPGLVIENYLRRTGLPGVNRQIKSIVNPREVRAFCVPHFFMYREGWAVDENRRPITKSPLSLTEEVSFARLRINHYSIKSEEEFRRKLARGPADSSTPKRDLWDEEEIQRRLRIWNDVADEDILMYLPDLRKAVQSRAVA